MKPAPVREYLELRENFPGYQAGASLKLVAPDGHHAAILATSPVTKPGPH